MLNSNQFLVIFYEVFTIEINIFLYCVVKEIFHKCGIFGLTNTPKLNPFYLH